MNEACLFVLSYMSKELVRCLIDLSTPCFQVPTVFDKQGAQLLAVAFLVVSRTWISDRIASLNGIVDILFLSPPPQKKKWFSKYMRIIFERLLSC